MRTQLVDGLFPDLLQVVRFLRVYMEHHCNIRSPPDEQTRLECRNVGSCMQVGRDFYLFKHNQSCERSMMITCFIFSYLFCFLGANVFMAKVARCWSCPQMWNGFNWRGKLHHILPAFFSAGKLVVSFLQVLMIKLSKVNKNSSKRKMAIKFFVCSIWKKVEIVDKIFLKILQTSLIFEIFKTKSILLSVILFYN